MTEMISHTCHDVTVFTQNVLLMLTSIKILAIKFLLNVTIF